MNTAVARAGDDLWTAITRGKPDFSLRYRFEYVEDDLAPGGIPLKDADASTLRTALGYKTGRFNHVDARLLLQDVRNIGFDGFNDGTARPVSRTGYATVADPSDTDFIEAYAGLDSLPDTYIKAGRQLIGYGEAPYQRFIGTVGWRQNWQNHDAISVTNTSLADTTINYAWSFNVNRIFTDVAAINSLANFDSNSHLLNIKYSGFTPVLIEAYTYLLDFENSPANSVASYGLRVNGTVALTETLQAGYAAEYAMQQDYAGNPANVDEDYLLGEALVSFRLSGPVESLQMKLGYERLSGNGSTAFQTPLATGHAYQGWADRFLTTPANGIRDYYATAAAAFMGAKLTAEYHDLNADNPGYDFGREIDLMITRTFLEHYTLGLKFAAYNADTNSSNTAGTTAADVSKFWGWLEMKF